MKEVHPHSPPGPDSPTRGLDIIDPDTFHFRGLHAGARVGTASDRYAGWLGQIYTADRFKGRITSRANRIKGKTFKEQVLPVDSVEEYFEHFNVLEIDYTFYSPLVDEKGQATQTFHVLKSYREHLRPNDFVILKVPQMVFAQKILRGGRYTANANYLDPEAFVKGFYTPASDLLGSNLRGFVFEQEYQRKEERTPPDDLAATLDAFFESVPKDPRYHIELRTESYLTAPIFQVMEKHGIGQVLSHWTWLPPPKKQLAKADHRFFSSGRETVIRLMTPIGTRYEDAYARAHPFDRLVEGLLQPAMIDETAGLMWEAIEQDIQINLIINNRSGGNAPLIAQLIARRFLESPRNAGP